MRRPPSIASAAGLAPGHKVRPTTIRSAVADLRMVPASPSASTDDDNRRFAYRRPTASPAGIVVDRVSPPISCTLRNISSTGALIELRTSLGSWTHTADDLPDEFELQMPIDGMIVACEIARRNGRHVGVRFKSAARPMERPARPQTAAAPARPTAVFGKRS